MVATLQNEPNFCQIAQRLAKLSTSQQPRRKEAWSSLTPLDFKARIREQ
jgi:hypothetical protein